MPEKGENVNIKGSIDWFKLTGQVRIAKRVGVVVKKAKRDKA